MSDSSSSESGAEPGNDQLFAEAQKLLAKPPRPSEHPTDSFWLHTPQIVREKDLETLVLQQKPYDIVIVGTRTRFHVEAVFCLLLGFSSLKHEINPN